MAEIDPKFFDNLSKEIIAAVEKEALKLSNRLALILEREVGTVIGEKAFATGALQKSRSSEVEKELWGYLIKVFTGVHYAGYVHEGTKPHYPPIMAIRDWVRKKGLINRRVVGRKKLNVGSLRLKKVNITKIKSYKSMDDYWQVDQIARAIAWKIYKKGTSGVKFFDIALKQAIPKIEAELKNSNFKLT
jgi:hypothetical protein